MKIDKIYKLIFGEIIKPKQHQRKFEIDDDTVFVTPNGFCGFVFSKKEIPFNLEMVEDSKSKIDILSTVKLENLLKKTNHYVRIPQGLINVFQNNDEKKIYINEKYLNYFEDYAEFYQEKDLSLCVVVENGQVVGAVCPTRYFGESDSE